MPEFDHTRPVQTTSGARAEKVCDDLGGGYPLGFKVEVMPGVWKLYEYSKCGRCYGCLPGFSLINIPEKRVYERWVNVYEDMSWPYPTRERADARARVDRIACIHIYREYTPGEGLEPAENT